MPPEAPPDRMPLSLEEDAAHLNLGRAIAAYRALLVAVPGRVTTPDFTAVLERIRAAARVLADPDALARGSVLLQPDSECKWLDQQIEAYGRRPTRGHAAGLAHAADKLLEVIADAGISEGIPESQLAGHLANPGEYPPRRHAVIPVGALTAAMLTYPDLATEVPGSEEAERRRLAQMALPSYPSDERQHLDAGDLRPVDCFRCAGDSQACPLVEDRINWRACPHAHTRPAPAPPLGRRL